MSKTLSTMLTLGTAAPLFSLFDVVNEETVSLQINPDIKGTVIMFICNHCPYVKHVNAQLTQLANDYQPRNIRFIAINSNDIEYYPEDSPEKMKKTAIEEKYPFPYLFDETQEVAQAYQAACTPDFYVFDENLLLVYRGQLDDARPNNQTTVTGGAIRHALDRLLTKQPITIEQKPSLGCNIKWKK